MSQWPRICAHWLMASGNVGPSALDFPGGERIEIDELRIVVMGIAMEPSAAMDVHQGLHTPGI